MGAAGRSHRGRLGSGAQLPPMCRGPTSTGGATLNAAALRQWVSPTNSQALEPARRSDAETPNAVTGSPVRPSSPTYCHDQRQPSFRCLSPPIDRPEVSARADVPASGAACAAPSLQDEARPARALVPMPVAETRDPVVAPSHGPCAGSPTPGGMRITPPAPLHDRGLFHRPWQTPRLPSVAGVRPVSEATRDVSERSGPTRTSALISPKCGGAGYPLCAGEHPRRAPLHPRARSPSRREPYGYDDRCNKR